MAAPARAATPGSESHLPGRGPRLPFLGVHFTRRISDNAVWLGPNAVLALAREGYRRSALRVGDLTQTLRYPIPAYGGTGVPGAAEVYRDLSRRAFVAACQRFVPELTHADVIAGPSGTAQSVARDGGLVDDFVFNLQGNQLMHVRNAPSPAATSCLAIGAADRR